MVYEVKRDEVTQEKWDEMRKIARNNVCADCGAELQIHTNPERGTLEIGCLDKDHHGYVERETYTQAYRRGAIVHPAIQAAIEKKMMPKSELGRAMNLLALRYPDAIKDAATAALFIMDCARLDLDPLIQPAEAIPTPFKTKKKDAEGKVIEEKVTIQMIITEDGWLSMAARGCKEEWNGPPRTMRLEEYLTTLKENEGKTREDIQTIAKEIKKSACKDEEAWYYVAIGRSKSMTEDANQARVRAIKKWVRHVYPECRQKMKELTAEWSHRAEGIQAAQQFIDAEYSFISLPEGEGDTGGEAGKEKAGAAASKARSQAKKQETSPHEIAEGEGLSIDLDWLKEAKQTLKWTDETMLSFITSQYKVSGKSDTEALNKLNRDQAEDFTRQINAKMERQSSLF